MAISNDPNAQNTQTPLSPTADKAVDTTPKLPETPEGGRTGQDVQGLITETGASRDKGRLSNLFTTISKNVQDSLTAVEAGVLEAGAVDLGKQAEKRMRESQDVEEEGSARKQRRLNEGYGEGSPVVTVGAKPPWGVAQLLDGRFVMVFERIVDSHIDPSEVRTLFKKPHGIKTEPVNVIDLLDDDEEEGTSAKNVTKHRRTITTTNAASSSSSTQKKGAASVHTKPGQTAKPTPTNTKAKLEQRLIGDAIPVWQLQQACLQMFPSEKLAVQWAETALSSAVAGVTANGGESMMLAVTRLLRERRLEMLLEIRNHSGDLIDTVLKSAATEVPVAYQGIFTGDPGVIAWRVRHLLEDYHFIYEGNTYMQSNSDLGTAFLSSVVVAVIGSAWKSAMNSMDDEIFDPMPLGIIAVATCGIWAYLKSWWDGLEKPGHVIDPVELEDTYHEVMDNLEGFELAKPEACLKMQKEVTRRVKGIGAGTKARGGKMFLKL
ncbi:hypothetical protein CALCODRAFT_547329 [Calocera cornea HHB12733]|uniref:DUF6532 domain-containing protein n=1 Tax=Calocera cornea HHB12733 TaxID=1353952 RepID=A0A165EHR2_9BASI|nr:hypothetical protein CALCODRAFT_547329 [Calocera cornea HHB12733]